MREFLKAFLLIFTLVVICLFGIRYASFSFLDPVKQLPPLKEYVFPFVDETMKVVRSMGRDGIGMVPYLQQQPWLVELMAESTGESAGDVAANGTDINRSPAVVGGETIPAANINAPVHVGGALKELLGQNFQILGQSLISSTALSPVEISLPQTLNVYLKEDSQIILWSVRGDKGEVFLVEIKKGAIDLRKLAESSANVALSLNSGAYKKLGAGERWIAAVMVRGRGVLEGARVGTRAEFPILLKNLSVAPKSPGPVSAAAEPLKAPPAAVKSAEASKSEAPKAAVESAPSPNAAAGTPAAPGNAAGTPAPETGEAREPAGNLDSGLQ